MTYPPALLEIVQFFEQLSEPERREALITYAEMVSSHARKVGETYDFTDLRKDEQCTDKVGVYLKVETDGTAWFDVELGPKVQTLTRALTAILCRGLNGSTLAEIIEISPDFVPRIIGADLVRLRSRTVYYILDRMKEAARHLKGAQ